MQLHVIDVPVYCMPAVTITVREAEAEAATNEKRSSPSLKRLFIVSLGSFYALLSRHGRDTENSRKQTDFGDFR